MWQSTLHSLVVLILGMHYRGGSRQGKARVGGRGRGVGEREGRGTPSTAPHSTKEQGVGATGTASFSKGVFLHLRPRRTAIVLKWGITHARGVLRWQDEN